MSNILPTADMATTDPVLDYSSIKRVMISFFNDLLDASAGDVAPEFDDFFDDSNESESQSFESIGRFVHESPVFGTRETKSKYMPYLF